MGRKRKIDAVLMNEIVNAHLNGDTPATIARREQLPYGLVYTSLKRELAGMPPNVVEANATQEAA